MALTRRKVFLVPRKKYWDSAKTTKSSEGGRSIRCRVFCCTKERENGRLTKFIS